MNNNPPTPPGWKRVPRAHAQLIWCPEDQAWKNKTRAPYYGEVVIVPNTGRFTKVKRDLPEIAVLFITMAVLVILLALAYACLLPLFS